MESNNTQSSNNVDVTKQILDMSNRIQALEQEVYALKSAVYFNKQPQVNVTSSVKNVAPQNNKSEHNGVPNNTVTNKVVPQQNKATSMGNTVVTNNKVTKSNENLEKQIGKNVMGIAAAILVLVSIILFGGLIVPFMTPMVKFILMYMISIAFTVVGILFMKRESKYYTLFSAIAAVGISGCYITDLIGCMGLGVINDLLLLILIAIWLAITIALSKLKSRMFAYVSNVGLIIASILASIDWSDAYIGLILYFIGVIIILIINKSDNFNYDSYIFIQVPIVSIIFANLYLEHFILYLLLCVNIGLFIYYQLKYKLDTKHLPCSIVSYGLMWLSNVITVWVLADYTEPLYLVILPILAVVSFCLIKLTHSKDEAKDIVFIKVFYYITFITMMVTLVVLPIVPLLNVLPIYLIIAIIFMLLGYEQQKLHCKLAGLFYFLLALSVSYYSGLAIAVALLSLAIIGYMYAKLLKQYTLMDKYIIVFFTIIYLLRISVELEFNFVMGYIVFAIYSIYLATRYFINNYNTNEVEKSSLILSWVYTGILLFIGVICLGLNSSALQILNKDILGDLFANVLLVIVILAMSCAHIKRQLNSAIPQSLVSIYTCFKFMTIIIVVMSKLNALSIIMTIVLLLFAIACIILGFIFKLKACRLYGLVLTLICVLKLILIDITYDSILLRPLGFFIAGILCFGISWGYSRFEKSQMK